MVDYSSGDYRGATLTGGAPPSPCISKQGCCQFQLILTSLTDQEFKFKALLFKDGQTKYEKEFTVTMDAAQSEKPADLEQRAYRIVDSAFTTIIKDREFQKSILISIIVI